MSTEEEKTAPEEAPKEEKEKGKDEVHEESTAVFTPVVCSII